MTRLLLMAQPLAAVLPADVPPSGPFDSGSDWVAPALVAFGVVLLVAVAAVALVLIRRRR